MKTLRFGSTPKPTRVFFAADLHGSETAFRKFLAVPAFYGVDALVFGGDLMGKAVVPIVHERGRYRARLHDVDHEFEGESGLAEFRRAVETAGYYWSVMEPDAYVATEADPFAIQALFERLATKRLADWIALAEERLAGTGVRLYLTGGNDDEPAVLEELDRIDAEHVVASEGRVVELDGEHTMITVGLSTVTPWDTPREASEEEIGARIAASAGLVPDMGRCVFNLHCPPKDTPLDTCLKLEPTGGLGPGERAQPIRVGGQLMTTGGGSVAVRRAIETMQPLIGLHGHIHESMGRFRLGRTPCFNPGSEYAQGRLQGWIVALRGGEISAYQHTSG